MSALTDFLTIATLNTAPWLLPPIPQKACSRPKPGARWLLPASFTVCLLAAGALAITLFGRPHAPPAMTWICPRRPQRNRAAAPHAAADAIGAAGGR